MTKKVPWNLVMEQPQLFECGYEALTLDLRLHLVGREHHVGCVTTITTNSIDDDLVWLASCDLRTTADWDVVLSHMRNELDRTRGMLTPF